MLPYSVVKLMSEEDEKQFSSNLVRAFANFYSSLKITQAQ